MERRLGSGQHFGVVVDCDDVVEAVQQCFHDKARSGTDVQQAARTVVGGHRPVQDVGHLGRNARTVLPVEADGAGKQAAHGVSSVRESAWTCWACAR